MSARLGVNHRVLSRLKYDRGAGLSDDTLIHIMGKLDDDDESARFLACYLRDRVVGSPEVRSRIRVLVDDPALVNEVPLEVLCEVSEAARRLERAAIKNERVRLALLSLSELVSAS